MVDGGDEVVEAWDLDGASSDVSGRVSFFSEVLVVDVVVVSVGLDSVAEVSLLLPLASAFRETPRRPSITSFCSPFDSKNDTF